VYLLFSRRGGDVDGGSVPTQCHCRDGLNQKEKKCVRKKEGSVIA